MPNRIIKESICRSEDIDKLSYFEEVLFYRLIVNCDDYGRFDGRTRIIKGLCFPLKDIKEKDIENGVRRLSELGLIVRYEVNGKQFIQLSTWEDHQQVRSKRSKYPGMDDENANVISNDITCDHMISDDSRCDQMISNDSICPRNPIQSNTIQSENNPNVNTKKKHSHGERGHVKLTDEEYDRLVNDFGEEKTKAAIQLFDDYIEEKGYTSKSHNLTMRRWVFKAVDERKTKPAQNAKIHNFEERRYDASAFDRLVSN